MKISYHVVKTTKLFYHKREIYSSFLKLLSAGINFSYY